MILTAQAHGKHAAVLYLQGDVDGETYGRLLVEAQQLVTRGARILLLELSQCEYMSSAGLVALTSIFKQMRDLSRSENSASWETKNTLERAGESGPPRQLALVNPRLAVQRTLTLSGMQAFLPIYPDIATAMASMSGVQVQERK